MGKKRVCKECKEGIPNGQDGLCDECRENPPAPALIPPPQRSRKEILAGLTAILRQYILPEDNIITAEFSRPPIRDEEAEEKAGIGHVFWKSGPEMDINIHIEIGQGQE